MYPAKFDYHRASSVDEALSLLAANDGSKLLAGGHSLLPMMKLRLAQPSALIDIGRIDALRGITASGDGLSIGPLTTHAEIAASAEVREHCPYLAEAAGHVGDQQVRNRGTIGGNIAHADPGSDLPGVLVAADATVHLKSSDGERSVKARDFFLGLLHTELGENEVMTAIDVPASGATSAYLKFEHPASGYAVVGAGARVTLSGGTCSEAVVGINGVSEIPVLFEADLSGGHDEAAIEAACDGIAVEDPLSDVFATGEYRLHLAKVFAKRALVAAIANGS